MQKYHIKKLYLKITGKSFDSQYNTINNITTNEELSNFQEDKLKDFLIHCSQNSQYYKRILKKININKINEEEFEQIPVLTKDIIRTNFNNLISVDAQKRNCFYNTSGGSTGEPVKFVQDESYRKWANATNLYYYNDILDVHEPSIKKVLLWGSERDLFAKNRDFKGKFANWVNNVKFLNTFKMNPNDMDRYVNIINSFKPELIRGYASSLYEFCRYIEKKGKDIHSPKFVISTAEPLRNRMKEQIENVMGTKVYNFYGSREISNLAGECERGSLHFFPFWNKYEVLDDNNKPLKQGKEGKIILTNLFNYSMPLLRYEIGDIGAIGTKKCKCGNIMPTLEKVSGRLYENFIKKDGTFIYGHYFTYQFYFKDWIKSFQIIQEDYDKIRIVAVLNSDINNSDKKEIERKIRLLMGQTCEIKWDFVDEIATTKSGKYMWVKSLIK